MSRPPTLFERIFDKGFRNLALVMAWMSVVLLLLFLYQIGSRAMPAIKAHGLDLITERDWNTPTKEYGLWPQIFGTMYSSVLALVIGMVLGVAIAIFLTEDFLPETLRSFLKNTVELLSAIPSVIYGLWGLTVVIPWLKWLTEELHQRYDAFPVLNGPSMLPAALVLAIMILPTITALSRDAIANVPGKLKEGAYGLGATRWETILKITLPTASTGIFGAVILAFGRALGETMALAMLVGNMNVTNWNPFSPANTLAALMANNFPEEISNPPGIAALMYAALVLMAITLIVNMLGSLVIWKASSKVRGLN